MYYPFFVEQFQKNAYATKNSRVYKIERLCNSLTYIYSYIMI
jgi:hypothetical protein